MSEVTPEMAIANTILIPELREVFTSAATIENPLDRGLILGNIAGKLLGKSGFDGVKAAALTAHAESLEEPWASGDYEFGPEAVLGGIAEATRDTKLAEQLPAGYTRNNTLLKIAVSIKDPAIIPSDCTYGHDNYFFEEVKQGGSESDAHAIESIETRIDAFCHIIARYEKQGMFKESQKLHDEAWRLVEQEPDEQIRGQLYVRLAKDFQTAHRIPNLIVRVRAFESLYRRNKEDPNALESYRQESTQAVTDAITQNNEPVDDEALSKAILGIYTITRDPKLIEFMNYRPIAENALYDQLLSILRKQNDISLVASAPHNYYQGTHMAEIVADVSAEEVALTIEDKWWQNRALAHVAAKMDDGPERRALQMRVINNALANPEDKPGYSVSADIVQAVRTMDDSRLGWALLEDPRISCRTIAGIAKYFNDGNLALQISDDRPDTPDMARDKSTDGIFARDSALEDIAIKTADIHLARKIQNPTSRSWALLRIYSKNS